MKTRVIYCALAVAVTLLFGLAPTRSADVAPPAVQPHFAPPAAPEQPVPFSHKWHAGTMKLPCQTCHANPAPGNQMTFPPTSTCMSCHASIATDRPAIKKLAEYASNNKLVPWVRVYKVMPGVTWTHAKHLQAGVQCQTCHGTVTELETMSQQTSVTGMASCMSCHETRGAKTACVACHAWPAKSSSAINPQERRTTWRLWNP